MRSPYGKKGKAILAPDAAYATRGLTFDAKVTVRVDASLYQRAPRSKATEATVVWQSWQLRGKSTKTLPLRGPAQQPNVTLTGKRIRYLEPKTVVYADGARGAACTLNMHHKSGYRGLKVEGQRKRRMPTATKRYAVAKK